MQVRSGTDAKKDSYSAFGAKEPESGKSLLEVLQDRAARRVFVLGLATDYVVKAGSSSITVPLSTHPHHGYDKATCKLNSRLCFQSPSTQTIV